MNSGSEKLSDTHVAGQPLCSRRDRQYLQTFTNVSLRTAASSSVTPSWCLGPELAAATAGASSSEQVLCSGHHNVQCSRLVSADRLLSPATLRLVGYVRRTCSDLRCQRASKLAEERMPRPTARYVSWVRGSNDSQPWPRHVKNSVTHVILGSSWVSDLNNRRPWPRHVKKSMIHVILGSSLHITGTGRSMTYLRWPTTI